MYLVLRHHGLDAYFREELPHLLDIIVGHAERTYFALGHGAFHRLVGFHVVVAGMVQQHQVHIADAEPCEGCFDGFLRVAELVRIEFGADEKLLAGQARAADSFAYLFLVAVESSGVELAVA